MKPSVELLPEYSAALNQGWSPDNLRPEVAQEQLAAISDDPISFLAWLEDRKAKGPPITLPNGVRVARLPGFRRWIWKDGFCGTIGIRWQPGTEALPPHCSGHVGYAVVPWRRNEGLASAALLAFLPDARETGLRYIELTADPENKASTRVIEKAGGVLIKRFHKDSSLGGGEALCFHISLAPIPDLSGADL